MTPRFAAVLLLLHAAILLPAPQEPKTEKTSVEGAVLRAGTNEPLAGVRVLLLPISGDTGTAEMTGADGKFAFKNVDGGTYRLAFGANGYVLQEFGQRVFGGKGSPLTLEAGKKTDALVIRMTPTGSVSGRVQDRDDNPLVNVPVRLLRRRYNENGVETLQAFGDAVTDDMGEYRIYFVTPGPYYVQAGMAQGAGKPERFGAAVGRNAPQESFAPQFFPGTRDERNAKVVDVQSAVDRRGIDFTLEREQRFRVRGRVFDTGSESVPKQQTRVLIRNLDGPATEAQVINRDGIFELKDAPAGHYALTASSYEPVAADAPTRNYTERTGTVFIDVVDQDLDGIVVTLGPALTISGKITGEDGGAANLPGWLWNVSTGGPPHGGSLTPVADGLSPPVSPQFSYLEADGTFKVLNLIPGEYVFSIDWLSDQYIKAMRFEGADVTNRPFRVTGAENETLEIVISPKVGAIEGKAVNDKLEPLPAAQIALVPEFSRGRAKLFKGTITDANGVFSFPHVAPGDYRLFAWEALEPYAYFDPEVLRRSESRSIAVHVEEGSKQTFSLSALPAP